MEAGGRVIGSREFERRTDQMTESEGFTKAKPVSVEGLLTVPGKGASFAEHADLRVSLIGP